MAVAGLQISPPLLLMARLKARAEHDGHHFVMHELKLGQYGSLLSGTDKPVFFTHAVEIQLRIDAHR